LVPVGFVPFVDELLGIVVFGLEVFPVELFNGTVLFDVVFVTFFGRIVLFVVFPTVLLPIEVFVVFVEFKVGAVLLPVELLVEFVVFVGLTIEVFVFVTGFVVFV
jgi:hypothetical protein